VIDGTISATGVYDDVEATGVRIGGSGGFATVLTGGLSIDGAISAVSYNANAQGLHLADGADVPSIVVGGSVYAGMAPT